MWLLLVLGCGGGGGRSYGTAPTPGDRVDEAAPVGPPDMVAIRALLDRYSPSGSWIVRTYESIPMEFKFGRTTITLAKSEGFEAYVDDNAPNKVVHYTSVGVHEIYHGLTYRLQFQLQADAKAKDAVKAEGHWIKGEPTLVLYTPIFPAREMVATFPVEARGFRWETYISTSNDIQSTQQQGVFGLLDEWTAYMQEATTELDYWPWIRDEAPKTNAVYTDYRARLVDIPVPAAEFRLYILHYMIYARDKQPDVYRGLMANESFRRAFIATDDAWNSVVARYESLEPEMERYAAERGATGTTYGRHDSYPAIMKQLASAPYQAMLAELRRVR